MSDQKNKNHRTIIVLALMSIIPFSIAWMLTGETSLIPSATNKGDLVVPIITTEVSDLEGVDAFSAENIKEIGGHWVMLNSISGDSCDKICADAIHATKQIRLMLNKDLTRVRRAVIIVKGKQQDSFSSWWKGDLRLLKLKPSEKVMAALKKYKPEGLANGSILIMDPLGNIMMHYGAGFDPYAVKSDLKKLLRISQIG